MPLFDFCIHHGGQFVRESGSFVFYQGGDETFVRGQDSDTWSYYEALSLVMECGFDCAGVRLWRKIEGTDEKFFHVTDDVHVTEIANHALTNNVEGHIWLEKFVGGNTIRVENPNITEVAIEESSEESSEDEEADGVTFGDSEEERVNDAKEGFVVVEVDKPNEGNWVEIGGKKLRFKLRARKNTPTLSSPKKLKLHVHSKIAGGQPSNKSVVEEDGDYESEELGSSDPDASDDEKMPKYEKFRGDLLNKDYEFKLGMEFNSLVEFKDAIREWSVLNGREIRFVKNESNRVRVECRGKCGFLALCSKVGDKQTFQLKTLVGTHTCARVLNNKSANSKWVSKVVVEKRQYSGKVKVSDLMAELRSKYSVGITKGRAWRGKNIAEEIIEGDSCKQYSMLYRYAAELKKQNDGNTAKINVDRPIPTLPPRFGSFYFCFDGCKKGFLNGCRPFIGVDGCHLKTKYGGQLLIAVARDPNDQYFPLAFGVVETESKESWRWFLQLLMEDIGQQGRYVFISDQQKGLVAVFEEMFESIEHRICLRHLYANFKKKFGGGSAIRDLMMGVAKATYVQAWEKKMSVLRHLDPKAWEWLVGVPTKLWCKHAFSYYPKCDVLMNNISESFNSTILQARDKPIISMCEWIRNYLMNRIAGSLTKLDKWKHKTMPMPRKRMDKEVALSGNWIPSWCENMKWQVNHTFDGHQFIVDLSKKTCTCCFWDLVGIPCRHAISAMSYQNLDPESFVDSCYSRETYTKCYSFSVSPTNGMDMWPNVEVEDVLPPTFKKGPGRPRKLRIRELDENGSRMRRPGVTYRCTKCDRIGHNSRKCQSTQQNPNALKRKRKAPRNVPRANIATVEEVNPSTTTTVEVMASTATAEEMNPTQSSQLVNPTQ